MAIATCDKCDAMIDLDYIDGYTVFEIQSGNYIITSEM